MKKYPLNRFAAREVWLDITKRESKRYTPTRLLYLDKQEEVLKLIPTDGANQRVIDKQPKRYEFIGSYDKQVKLEWLKEDLEPHC